MTKCSFFRAILVAAGLMTAAVFATPANALVTLDIRKGNVQPLPIAVTDFLQG
ncbi:Tol-Pal system protein TolB, partial [Bradyrhizobium sp. 23AC]